jgi:hypothetical protein
MGEIERTAGDTPFRGRRVGLRYDPAEDRLLLTLTDAAGNHRAFWLTRRIALGLAGLARQEAERLATQAAGPAKPRSGAQGPVVQPATAKAAPDEAAAARQAARLLIRVRVRRPKAGCVLAFEAEGEAPALLALDDAALGRFQGLVDGLARRAQWVAPARAAAEKPEGPPAAPRPKRRLH